MGFINVKCPNCNTNVSIEDGKKSCFCPACGTKIEKEETIINNNITIIQQSEIVDSVIKSVEELMNNQNYEKALERLNDIFMKYPNDYRLLFMIYVCEINKINKLYLENYYSHSSLKLKDIIKDVEEKYYNHAYNYAPNDIKEQFSNERNKLYESTDVLKAKSNSIYKTSNFNVIVFVLLLVIFFPAAIVYWIICLLKKIIE